MKKVLSKFVCGCLRLRDQLHPCGDPRIGPTRALATLLQKTFSGAKSYMWSGARRAPAVAMHWCGWRISARLYAALLRLAQMPWITSHKGNVGIYVAWAFSRQHKFASIVRYLTETPNLAFRGTTFCEDLVLDETAPALACQLPPGTQL
jgi:hypothetical protein